MRALGKWVSRGAIYSLLHFYAHPEEEAEKHWLSRNLNPRPPQRMLFPKAGPKTSSPIWALCIYPGQTEKKELVGEGLPTGAGVHGEF